MKFNTNFFMYLKELSYQILCKYTNNKDVQDEIFSSLLEKICLKPGVYTEMGKLYRWLQVTLKNSYLNYRHAQITQQEKLEKYFYCEEHDVYLDKVDRKVMQRELLDDYLQKLQKNHVDSTELKIVESYFIQYEKRVTIARNLHVSYKTVRRIINLHIKKISSLFQAQDYDLSC